MSVSVAWGRLLSWTGTGEFVQSFPRFTIFCSDVSRASSWPRILFLWKKGKINTLNIMCFQASFTVMTDFVNRGNLISGLLILPWLRLERYESQPQGKEKKAWNQVRTGVYTENMSWWKKHESAQNLSGALGAWESFERMRWDKYLTCLMALAVKRRIVSVLSDGATDTTSLTHVHSRSRARSWRLMTLISYLCSCVSCTLSFSMFYINWIQLKSLWVLRVNSVQIEQ